MHARCWIAFLAWWLAGSASAQTLALPERAANSPSAAELIQRLTPLDLASREQEIYSQISAGNVPDFLRMLKTVFITNEVDGVRHVLKLHVAPDYLAIGSDAGFLRVPLTPATAQRIADLTDCSLPTQKIVDAIWTAAELRLAPEPMSPGPEMTSIPVFAQHQGLVEKQIGARSHRQLIAGHKKDVVLASVLATKSNSVAIYGWHKPDGKPIQPVYAGHAATWADYSHGIRLVANDAELDGKPVRLPQLLSDSKRAAIASDEGPLRVTRYSTNRPVPVAAKATKAAQNSSAPTFTPGETLKLDFKPTGRFGETEAEFRFSPEVRVVVNKVAASPATNTLLVIYALPNGNTIEQTAGHRPQANEDWHFNIQHIAAQMRFVRERLPGQNIVLAYVEADGLSWPAWRKRNGNDAIPAIVQSLQSLVGVASSQSVLSGHSGGGSFIFGHINAVTNIPASVERIAFLDANYGYTPAHKEKLLRWLRDRNEHRLLVFAYNDAAGLLNGKPFVSAEGGTWGRSALMLEQLGGELAFNANTNGSLHTHGALNGRVEFLLRENPERKIWHTVLVERNGFIHALLSGTPHTSKDYEYLGERAYEKFILSR
jgi:hypothetical protein